MEVSCQVISGTINKGTWITIKEASDISGRSVNSLRLMIHRGKLRQIKKVKGKGHGEWLIHSNSLSQIADSDLPDDMPCEIPPDTSDNMTCQDLSHDMSHNVTSQENPDTTTYRDHSPDNTAGTYQDSSKPMIPLEYYDSRRDEWMLERDRLLQGLMMYRYKFEELDRQLKILPAPPEFVKAKLNELEQHLQEKAELASQYEEKIALAAREKDALGAEYEQTKTSYEEYISQFQEKLQQEEHQQTEMKAALEAASAELSHLRRPWWKKLLGAK